MKPFCYNPPLSPLDIIHIDSSIIVLNKPSGVLTIPGRGIRLSDSLLTRVKEKYFGTLLVHRLDMDTSGIIIFARTPSAQAYLGKQFEKRSVKKKYLARTTGHIKEPHGIIELPIIVDWPNRPLQKICFDKGKVAITKYRVLRHEEENCSLVALYPLTGRTHQLRLHMKCIGHPIIGDTLYLDKSKSIKAKKLNLHSSSIKFLHPKTNKMCTFFTPTPSYFSDRLIDFPSE